MGTEILHPQDILIQRNPNHNHNHKSYRKQLIRPKSKKPIRDNPNRRIPSNDFNVMGRVSILKRGGPLDFVRKDTIPSQTCDLGLEMLVGSIRQKNISCDDAVYAGSTVYLSPSPRKLPLPSFSRKKEGMGFVDSTATMDLRRILRLD